MSFHTVNTQIEASYRSRLKPETLRHAAQATLRHENVEEPCELVVVVTGDETLHQLNRHHRCVDAPTDVLAFPHQTKGPPPFVLVDAPGLPRYLGDVIISFPRAEAQAIEAQHELLAELQLLVVHGVLHLLGYDDQTASQRALMWQAQQDVLDGMDVEVHLPD